MGIVEKVKLPLKRKMDKIMFSLAIYGVACLTVSVDVNNNIDNILSEQNF